MSRRRRIARWAFACLIGLPLLAAILLFFAMYSEPGSRWVIAQALKSAPDQVRIGSLHGRLWDQFELADVGIEIPAAQVKIKNVSVRWRPRALFRGEFIVESTVLDGVDVTVRPQTSESEPSPPTALPAPPLPLELKRMDLRKVSIHLSGSDIIIDDLGFGAVWNSTQFALNGFELAAYGHRLGAASTVAVGHQPKVKATADWAGEIGGEPGSASLQVTGPLNKLAFESTIEAQTTAHVSGSINPLADVPSLSLHGDVAAPDLGKDVTLGKTQVDVVGTFESLAVSIATDATTSQTGAYALALDTQIALLGATDDAITAEFNWSAKPARTDREDIVGSGRVRYDGTALRIDHATADPYPTRLAASAEVQHDEPVLDVEFGWNDISYPITDDQVVTARKGTVRIGGPMTNLHIDIMGEFDVPSIGRAEVSGELRYAGQEISVPQFKIAMLSGEMQSDGKLILADYLSGNFEFIGRNIDLSKINADTPSRLGFRGRTAFTKTPQGITSQVELSELSGYLRGHALTGDANLRTKPGEIMAERVSLMVGPNRVDFRGLWAGRIDGEFDLNIEEMAVFDQRLMGSLSGQGIFAGQPTSPQVKAQITGNALRFDRYAAETFNLDIDVDMVRDAESRADLNIGALSIDGKAIGNLLLDGRGNARAHVFQVDLDGGPVKLHATANGVFDKQNWRGRMRELLLKSDTAGEWSLASPSEIALAADAASLSEACLVSGSAHACISGEQQATDLSAHVNVAAVPLALANVFLPTNLRLRGVTDAIIDLNSSNGVVTGNGNARVTDGIVERDAGGSKPDELAIRTFSLDFDLLPQSIRAEANADIEQWFTLSGTFSTARTPGGAVSAAIDARADDISWIAEFVPELSGTNGKLELASTINGTLEAPHGSARLRLTSGALQVPDIGLVLTSLETQVSGNSKALDIAASLGAGNGTLTVQGRAFIDNEERRYDLDLAGSNFPLVRIPEAEADISPELNLAGDTKTLDVSGTLLVPRVMIDVKRLPNSAVGVSEDQIILNGDNSAGDGHRAGSFLTDSVSGKVAVRLGNDISINGFGLASKLSGNLDWSKQRGSELGRANGVITIDEGVFKAYGQNMHIENGRLHFVGPVDNPRLTLQAVRPDLPVKAGVNVSGTVRTPKISLFSVPAMSDSNTLSYIVTGRAIDDASAGDASVLTQAALSLGAEQSAVVTNQIRNTFGLDELSVAAGTTARDTSFVAGKRLSPKLSVRTGFNPFDQLWSFFLNYKLTQRWSIEAESGERQGADLLYNIEGERLRDLLRLD